MHITVEVGGWEHECCGPAYERDAVIELICLVVSGQVSVPTRYVESHHDLSSSHETIHVRGRVAEISMTHADGSTEALARLPSGRALGGFDADDDGCLEQRWTGVPLVGSSDRYVLAIVT